MKTEKNHLNTRSSLLLLGLVVCNALTCDLFSQSVAINATGAAPNANAILDISSTTKGVLLPRMTTAQRTAIGNVAGMVVFDTDLGDIHHNTGSAWTKAITTNNIANLTWLVMGNAGTSSTTNFLGTTDAVALIFKTNNVERLQINSTGQIGMGAAPESTTRLVVNNTSNSSSTTTVVKGQNTQTILGSSANADSVIIYDAKFTQAGGTIEDFIGIKVGDVSGSNNSFRNSGTITNTYGVYIGDLTNGTQTNQSYAIYNGDPNSRNYHAGNTGFGEPNPTSTLHVKGSFKFDDGSPVGDEYKVMEFDPAGNVVWSKPGGLKYESRAVTTNYTFVADDYLVLAAPASGLITITLPAGSAKTLNRIVRVANISSGYAVRIAPNAGQAIKAASPTAVNLIPLQSVELILVGTTWYVLSGSDGSW